MADPRPTDDLDARIARAKAEHGIGVGSTQTRAENRGWAIGIEFVGVVLVAAAIGWGIDTYAGLGTKPWVMIGMLVLGFIAGVYRAAKTSNQFDADPSGTSR